MRSYATILVLLLFYTSNCFGQNLQLLAKKVISADSIWLVSHKQTDGIAILDTITNKKSYPEKVVHNGTPNFDVIIQSMVLPDSFRKNLVSILEIPNTDTIIETCQFIPFHSILIFKDGKIDFLDVCFACNSYFISDDPDSENIYMGIQLRKSLELFFKSQGINLE